MNAPVTGTDETAQLEQLLVIGRRLSEAVAADIAALEKGAFDELATTDPEVARLAALYTREVAALKAAGGVKTRSPLTAALRELGTKLKYLLLRHEKLVLCMREASEGLIQTIAREVDKKRKHAAPYTARPKAKRAATGEAIVYNKVV